MAPVFIHEAWEGLKGNPPSTVSYQAHGWCYSFTFLNGIILFQVERVEVKDVRLPQQLQRAMAAEAEASREARAKVIAAEGEQKAARALKEASDIISESPAALQVRNFNNQFFIVTVSKTVPFWHLKITFLEINIRTCVCSFFTCRSQWITFVEIDSSWGTCKRWPTSPRRRTQPSSSRYQLNSWDNLLEALDNSVDNQNMIRICNPWKKMKQITFFVKFLAKNIFVFMLCYDA